MADGCRLFQTSSIQSRKSRLLASTSAAQDELGNAMRASTASIARRMAISMRNCQDARRLVPGRQTTKPTPRMRSAQASVLSQHLAQHAQRGLLAPILAIDEIVALAQRHRLVGESFYQATRGEQAIDQLMRRQRETKPVGCRLIHDLDVVECFDASRLVSLQADGRQI